MARRLWKWLVIAAITIPLLVWGCDRMQVIHWVGSTDLQVEFVITDKVMGAPIPGAQLKIQQAKGGFYEDHDEKEFVLVSGADGRTDHQCRRSMCFGTRSGLRFTDTFIVHLPWWRFRVVAAGYEPSDLVELDVPQYIRRARRDGLGKAKLVVPVSLDKRRSEQTEGISPNTTPVGEP